MKLEESQRQQIASNFYTFVNSVSYGALNTSAPNIELRVEFFNLSVFRCTVKSWKLRIERTDTYQLLLEGQQYKLRRQKNELEKCTIEPCHHTTIEVGLEIEPTVAEAVRKAINDRGKVDYALRLDWELELPTLGPQRFLGYVAYSHISEIWQNTMGI